MDKIDIVIFFLLMFLIYIIIKKLDLHHNHNKYNEQFGSANSTDSANSTNPANKTKTVINPIDILEDKSFEDVVFYRSEPVWGEETGLQKCLENCNGTCMEFGVTNDSMCFPRNW